MLPLVPELDGEGHRRLADSITAAVAASGLPHVVVLSAIGADLTEGTGPILWLRHFEEQLRATGTQVTALRAPHFQEKVEELLDVVTHEGLYPVFADSADVPIPMVATRDVGAAAAQYLLSPPASGRAIELEAPSYTEREVAGMLGQLLGRRLEVATLPREAWLDTLIAAGTPVSIAADLVELYAAGEQGLLVARGDQRHFCTTGIDQTLREVLTVGEPSLG